MISMQEKSFFSDSLSFHLISLSFQFCNLQKAPKDKLLVFNVEQGWEPLCKFLEKDLPDKPFPWKNKNGSEIHKVLKKHQVTRQIAMEVIFVLACLIAVVGVLFFILF